MFHWLPLEELLRTIRFPAAPVKVRAPMIVWVVPAVNVICLPAVVEVKLKNEVEPDIVETPAPLKVTVPELWLKVPEFAQLPDTFMFPLGAVSVPDVIFTLVVVTVPDEPVNVPPLIVNPPFKLCVVVDA